MRSPAQPVDGNPNDHEDIYIPSLETQEHAPSYIMHEQTDLGNILDGHVKYLLEFEVNDDCQKFCYRICSPPPLLPKRNKESVCL
mmetsp:Transcript_14007/g.30731  ORF Transcript_14007/g.30731 Transcript_14007/m.30731 type:complete len:85 (+) Transcript_14007:759-1013(+)